MKDDGEGYRVDLKWMTTIEAEFFVETWAEWMGYEIAEWYQVNVSRRGLTKKQTQRSSAPSLQPGAMWTGLKG